MSKDAVVNAFSSDQKEIDVVTRKITIKGSTLAKMKKISSLFGEEVGEDAKEAEVISYFVEKSFEAFLRSGEIEKRIKSLTE